MDRNLISHRVGSILDDMSRLSNALYAMDTIEEGSRELNLVKRDENGNILNSVVHLLTRPSENPTLNINQDFLLERVLRKHPDVIGVGEMRSAAESLSAAESSRTGHTVCTTIHSNSCASTYRRMMTLTDNNGYPVAPPGWQGGGTSGGGSYTDSSILQYNGVLGRLNIKGRNITVYEGTDDTTLLYGAGHFTGTSAWDGNVCLAGHNRGPNAWFSQLISLITGDMITYSTALGVRAYQVTGTRIVSVNDLSPLNGSTENMLTLVTCLANQPSVRLIVTAQCIG